MIEAESEQLSSATNVMSEIRDLLQVWCPNFAGLFGDVKHKLNAIRHSVSQAADHLHRLTVYLAPPVPVVSVGTEWDHLLESYIKPRQFARGGLATPGLALVGEEGPELVDFHRPAWVYTAADTRKMLEAREEREKREERGVRSEEYPESVIELKALVRLQSTANRSLIDKLTLIEDRLAGIESKTRLAAA